MIMNANDAGRPVSDEPIPHVVWRQLYTAAAKVWDMKPWLWVEETDIFGVKDPKSDTILFVSVMGLLGEYCAVALYPGAKAVAQFWQMQNSVGVEDISNMLADIRQIHAAFGNKRDLDPVEKRVVKELGLKFKGADAWPYFRSYQPGYFPWVIDKEEARLLVLALEQLLEVAPRLKEDRRLVARKHGTCSYLVRMPHQKDGAMEWRDERHEYPPPASTFRITIPNHLVDSVRAMKSSGLTVELDVAPSPFPVGKKGERPQLPYMMLAADSDSYFVLGVELLTVEMAIEDMWMQVPSKFLEMLVKHGIRPSRLAIGTSWVAMVMQGICKDLGIEIKPDPELRAVRSARKGLEEFNGG